MKTVATPRFRRLSCILLPVLLLSSGCAGKFFRDAGKPPSEPLRFELQNWPFHEYWTGIVFNGNKIGFSHLSLSPSPDARNRFDIHSEVALRIRFLMLDKTINLKSDDRVFEDLSLDRFDYEYNLDGNRLQLNGRNTGTSLEIEILARGQTSRKSLPVKDTLYPAGIIGLYPVLHGLEVGRTYSYSVFDGETQTIGRVTQQILAYEESDLFAGQAFKIKTRLHGQETTTWTDNRGRPLLEMSLGGVIISGLESKSAAERYLAQAALNKDEALLEFCLVKSDVPVPEPARVETMEIALSGIGADFRLPADERQQCERRNADVFCKIISTPTAQEDSGVSVQTAQYLQSSYIIPAQNPLIRRTAGDIVHDTPEPGEQIRLLVNWIQQNIEQAPVDVFTALDVLQGKKAECQGISLLFTAFARSLGIPTRIVNGIVYSREFQGFLYHTWAESRINGHWTAVDATFRQVPADATHIKFIEGEKVSDLIPMVELIGNIQARIISMSP